MNKLVKPLMALLWITLANAAHAVNVVLIAHNQTSSGGTNSTLITDGSHPLSGPSTALWDWDGTTLSSTGLYTAVVAVGSSKDGSGILSDQVTDLAIDTDTGTGNATAYSCLEGTFLSGVGASGCGGHNLGINFMSESATTWGPGLLKSRTIGGDDVATGPQRDIAAYDFGTLDYVPATITTADELQIGDQILIGNGIEFVRNPNPPTATFPGAELMTFVVEASAVDDSVSAVPNQTKNIPVLANDLLRTGFSDLTITSSPSEGGTAVLNGDTIDFTSGPNFVAAGRETFEYSITDPGGPGDPMADPPIPAAAPRVLTATVTVTDGPAAVPDKVRVVTGQSASIDVLGNDGGLTDTPLTLVAGFSLFPTLGTESVVGSPGDPGTIRVNYTAGLTAGTDTFDYQVTDFLGKTSIATVEVTVSDPVIPEAVDDVGATFGRLDSSVDQRLNVARIDVLGNDNNISEAPLTVTIVDAPSKGQNGPEKNFNCSSMTSDCQVTYVPDPGATGEDSFSYRVTDVDGDSDTATVTVRINQLPVAVKDAESVSGGKSALFYVLRNDTGLPPANQGVVFEDLVVSVPPSQGSTSVVINADPNLSRIIYTPDPGTNASSDWFRYTVSVRDENNVLATSEARVDITIILDQSVTPGSSSTALSPLTSGLLLTLVPWLRRRRLN